MNRVDIFYAECFLGTHCVDPILPELKGITRCIQFLAAHPHNCIFYVLNAYGGYNYTRITWSGNQIEDYTIQICFECHQGADNPRILNRRQSVSIIVHTILCVAVFWKFADLWLLPNKLMARYSACTRLSIRPNLYGFTWSLLSFAIGQQTYISKIIPVVSLLSQLRELHPESKTPISWFDLYNSNIKMFYLFLNMRNIP